MYYTASSRPATPYPDLETQATGVGSTHGDDIAIPIESGEQPWLQKLKWLMNELNTLDGSSDMTCTWYSINASPARPPPGHDAFESPMGTPERCVYPFLVLSVYKWVTHQTLEIHSPLIFLKEPIVKDLPPRA